MDFVLIYSVPKILLLSFQFQKYSFPIFATFAFSKVIYKHKARFQVGPGALINPVRQGPCGLLNPALLGGFPQVSNSPHRPLLFPAVKTTTFHFLTVNLVSYTKKTSNSITKCTVIDSRLNGLRIFHFLVIHNNTIL